jgi:hypothetical protein
MDRGALKILGVDRDKIKMDVKEMNWKVLIRLLWLRIWTGGEMLGAQ